MKSNLVRLIAIIALILIPSALISIYTGNLLEIAIYICYVISFFVAAGLVLYLIGVIIEGSFNVSKWE